MTKKKPRQRRSSSKSSLSDTLRRLRVALITAGVVALQTTSCGLQPTTSGPSIERPSTAASSGFAACPQFFAGGVAPLTPKAPKLRELCYDAFAVLHSGSTRTPVFVAERLNRQLLLQARDQKRSDRFFADARLPRAERAELSDYKGSGYARGHMQYPVKSILIDYSTNEVA